MRMKKVILKLITMLKLEMGLQEVVQEETHLFTMMMAYILRDILTATVLLEQEEQEDQV